jgi:hypothetical protein
MNVELWEAKLQHGSDTQKSYADYLVQEAFHDVRSEIRKAVAKHGLAQTPLNPQMNDAEKLIILVEEIGEVARALTYDEGSTDELLSELTQVAAMALAWKASL